MIPPFIPTPRSLIESPVFKALGFSASRLLVLYLAKDYGKHNGKLGVTCAEAIEYGFSRTNYYSSLKELKASGLLVHTHTITVGDNLFYLYGIPMLPTPMYKGSPTTLSKTPRAKSALPLDQKVHTPRVRSTLPLDQNPTPLKRLKKETEEETKEETQETLVTLENVKGIDADDELIKGIFKDIGIPSAEAYGTPREGAPERANVILEKKPTPLSGDSESQLVTVGGYNLTTNQVYELDKAHKEYKRTGDSYSYREVINNIKAQVEIQEFMNRRPS